MPADNIKRAILKGTGQLEGSTYEEVNYEGYGPGGVAIYVEALSDNKNRTISELRHIFTKNGGRIGESGCVAWMFIDKSKAGEDQLPDIALASGAEDLRDDGSNWEIFTPPENYEAVVEALKQNEIEIDTSNLGYIPQKRAFPYTPALTTTSRMSGPTSTSRKRRSPASRPEMRP